METIERYPLRRVATVLAVVTLSLTLIAAVSGIMLGFYYEPTAGGAHESIRFITQSVAGGAVVRRIHDIAGNGLIAMALLQLIVLFLSRQFRSSWFTAWLSGIFLTLTAIALSWTAVILDWDQIGYWRLKIELGTIESIPVIGEVLKAILTGGSLGSLTVQHMYTLHSYVFAGVAIGLAVLHLGALIFQEKRQAGELTPEY